MQEYMSMPLSMFGVRIFYNRDMLKKLTGLDEAPHDYRAFLAACKKITSQKDPQGNNYKYYFDEPMPEGRFGYYYPSDGTRLTMEVPTDTVPYLCCWINEGGFKDFFNIAPEPCTGAWDQPGAAKAHKQASVLPADGEYKWHLSFTVTQE